MRIGFQCKRILAVIAAAGYRLRIGADARDFR